MRSNLFIYAAVIGLSLPFVALLVLILVRSALPESARLRFVAMRQSRRLPVILAIVVPAVFLVFTAVFMAPFGGSMFVRLLKNLPMAGMFAAIQFFTLSRRPVGDRVRCSRCKYDLTGLPKGQPSGPNGRHEGRCPECGGQWGWAGGTERLMKVWVWPWLAVGVALLLPMLIQFASAPIMGILWWEGTMLKLAPTSSLVEEVLTQKSFTMAAWAELGKRNVSPAETDRIARVLLTRPAGGYYSLDESAWLKTNLSAKSITRELVVPWLEKMFTVEAARGPTVGSVRLTLTPHSEQAVPFAGLEACIVVGPRGPIRPDQLAPLVITCGSAGMYKPYVLPTVEVQPGETQERFQGTMTVVLQLPGAPGVRVDERGKIVPLAGGLYEVEVPIDVPVAADK
jgi:hypothetical protein